MSASIEVTRRRYGKCGRILGQLGATRLKDFRRRLNGSGQGSGNRAKSRTDPDDAERLTGIYRSDGRWVPKEAGGSTEHRAGHKIIDSLDVQLVPLAGVPHSMFPVSVSSLLVP